MTGHLSGQRTKIAMLIIVSCLAIGGCGSSGPPAQRPADCLPDQQYNSELKFCFTPDPHPVIYTDDMPDQYDPREDEIPEQGPCDRYGTFDC
jgi:predicted small lipoprotein YifL